MCLIISRCAGFNEKFYEFYALRFPFHYAPNKKWSNNFIRSTISLLSKTC